MAVHVDHGLQPDSASWVEHCRRIATALEVLFESLSVSVAAGSGQGVEAAAREARYAALQRLLQPGDWLLSGHHRDDQAETVLLNLMRGSGTTGLGGIPGARRLGGGWLVRPLLDTSRDELEAYAESHSLETLTDPSNLEQQFDRNYLRHEILPRLDKRWPDAANRIRRSATLAREASMLLAELAEIDRRQCADRADRLSITALGELSAERQRNLLRYLILEVGLPAPGAAPLEQIVAQLVVARADAQPLVTWPGACARRYRDRLYLLPATDLWFDEPIAQKITGDRVLLPAGLGVLELRTGADRGLSDAVVSGGLELRFRVGGEEIKLAGQTHTRKLKKLLQEAGVVPWMRERLPLLYSGDELVAVADLWIAAEALGEPGTAIDWRSRPALH
jgi:tRNA(Ile)-lysidine synthase